MVRRTLRSLHTLGGPFCAVGHAHHCRNLTEPTNPRYHYSFSLQDQVSSGFSTAERITRNQNNRLCRPSTSGRSKMRATLLPKRQKTERSHDYRGVAPAVAFMAVGGHFAAAASQPPAHTVAMRSSSSIGPPSSPPGRRFFFLMNSAAEARHPTENGQVHNCGRSWHRGENTCSDKRLGGTGGHYG